MMHEVYLLSDFIDERIFVDNVVISEIGYCSH
jgi:hypothetical protein